MGKIIIAYWHSQLKELSDIYKHNQEFDYSEEKRNEIINVALSHNVSVMLKPTELENDNNVKVKTLVIYFDKGRFGQR